MIVTEIRELNGVQYRYTYSNEGRYLINEQGAMYYEAYDPIDIIRTYTEGDVIPDDDASAEELLEILLGENNE